MTQVHIFQTYEMSAAMLKISLRSCGIEADAHSVDDFQEKMAEFKQLAGSEPLVVITSAVDSRFGLGRPIGAEFADRVGQLDRPTLTAIYSCELGDLPAYCQEKTSDEHVMIAIEKGYENAKVLAENISNFLDDHSCNL